MNIKLQSFTVKEKNVKQVLWACLWAPGLVLDQGGVEPLRVSSLPGQEPAPFQLGRVLEKRSGHQIL